MNGYIEIEDGKVIDVIIAGNRTYACDDLADIVTSGSGTLEITECESVEDSLSRFKAALQDGDDYVDEVDALYSSADGYTQDLTHALESEFPYNAVMKIIGENNFLRYEKVVAALLEGAEAPELLSDELMAIAVKHAAIEKRSSEPKGEFYIKITPNFYSGQINAPQAHLLLNEDTEEYGDREIAVFTRASDAQAVIDLLEEGNYYLSHGEAGRPDYEIVSSEDFGPDCIKGHYDNEVAESEIPPEILTQLQDSNVDYEGEYDAEHDTYSAYVSDPDDEDWRYGIVFTVSTVNIQRSDYDLSMINWTDEVYTHEEL